MKRFLAMVMALAFVFALIPAVAPVEAHAAQEQGYIEISSNPTKEVYVPADVFSYGGLKVTPYTDADDDGNYEAGTEATVTDASADYTVTLNGTSAKNFVFPATTVPVTYTLKVEAQNLYSAPNVKATATATIILVPKVLQKVEITKGPDKTEYTYTAEDTSVTPTVPAKGEVFDPTGMVVTATYSDGSKAIVPLKTSDANGYTLDTPSTQTELIADATDEEIIVKYSEAYVSGDEKKTVTVKSAADANFVFNVVEESAATSVEIHLADDTNISGTQLTFKKSPAGFSPASYTINGLVKNGTAEAVTWSAPDKNVATFNSATGLITPVGAGSTSITFTETKSGATATVSIVVVEETSTYIQITTQPSKKVYTPGDSFDPASMVVTLFDAANPSGVPLMLGADVQGYDLEVCGAYIRYGVYTWKTHDLGQQLITVCYTAPNGAKYYDYTYVLVVKGIVASMEVESEPNVTEYDGGDKLDPTGLTYRLTYNNGVTEVIDYSDEDLEFIVPDGLDNELTAYGVSGMANVTAKYTQDFGKYSYDGTNTKKSVEATFQVKLDASLDVVRVVDQAATPAAVAEIRFYKTETGYFILQPGSDSNLVRAYGATMAGTTETPVAVKDLPAMIEWGYPDTSVASFYTKDGVYGTVTAVGLGETYLTLRARGSSETTTVKIIVESEPVAVRGITLDAYAKAIAINQTHRPTAAIQPLDAVDYELEWTLENVIAAGSTTAETDAAKIAALLTLNKTTGVVKGLKPCTAYLVATVTDGVTSKVYTARCKITVRYVQLEELVISSEELNMYESGAEILTATVSPSDATEPNVTWKSSNPSVATVNASGRVTALKTGTAIITCTAGTKTTLLGTSGTVLTKTCMVTVTAAKLVTKVAVNKTTLSLGLGEMETLSASITPTDATTKTVTWSSSNPAVATVNTNGRVTGVSAGSTTIYARANDGSGKYAVCTVTIKDEKSESIILSKTTLALLEDATAPLTATVYPDNASNKAVVWSSSNTEVARVSTTGVVTGINGGFAIITATAADGSRKYADCIVAVTAKIPVTSISMNMSDFDLLLGDTTQMVATVMPTTASNKSATWSSSNSGIVSVDSTGKVGGVSLGKATITATADGRSVSVDVTVTSALSKAGTVVNCKKRVNVRSKASGLSKSIGYAYLGEVFKILDQSGSWYKVQYSSGKTGYIWSNYINLTGSFYTSAGKLGTTTGSTGTTTGTTTTTPTTGTAKTVTIINCVSYVYIRSGPGTSYSKLGHADLGAKFDYVKTEGEWVQVNYNSQTAYIHTSFCQLG